MGAEAHAPKHTPVVHDVAMPTTTEALLEPGNLVAADPSAYFPNQEPLGAICP